MPTTPIARAGLHLNTVYTREKTSGSRTTARYLHSTLVSNPFAHLLSLVDNIQNQASLKNWPRRSLLKVVGTMLQAMQVNPTRTLPTDNPITDTESFPVC